MSSETMRRLRVIGFGNHTAGDLAVGLIAAAWAREELRHDPSVEVIEASPGIRALNLFENAEAVVAVEAVHPSGVQRQPGRLVRAVAGPDWLKADMSQALFVGRRRPGLKSKPWLRRWGPGSPSCSSEWRLPT
ncbi:MAG TPA: hypothetical protein VEQ37_02525 [Actinomycetota bacterium]|nr:hypothetical protein [Actinomycetota bacterium]